MEPVRKHAIGALHRCYRLDKVSFTGHVDKIRRALCDKGTRVLIIIASYYIM